MAGARAGRPCAAPAMLAAGRNPEPRFPDPPAPRGQDATLFHCLMLRNGLNSLILVGRGAATDSFVSLLLPQEFAMMMKPGGWRGARRVPGDDGRARAGAPSAAGGRHGRRRRPPRGSLWLGPFRHLKERPWPAFPAGEKLSDCLNHWRKRKQGGEVAPFVLFPQVGDSHAGDAWSAGDPACVARFAYGKRIRRAAQRRAPLTRAAPPRLAGRRRARRARWTRWPSSSRAWLSSRRATSG